MRMWEIVFMTGATQIVFAKNRQEIRKKFIAIRRINAIIIH